MEQEKEQYSVFFSNYSIGADAYQSVSRVCLPYGKRILLVGGKLALGAGEEKLKAAIKDSGLSIERTVVFGEDCTSGRIGEIAAIAKAMGADMVFGMGGGKALDTAKGAAYQAGRPVFTFPTIAATCAATTALSVVYKENGDFDRFLFYERPAVHCFIDPAIIAKAPEKYLRAGMGDAIGKYFECHLAARGDMLSHNSALGREISNLCYGPIREHGLLAFKDAEAKKDSYALRQAVLANIVSTGLVSLLVLDDYNCAIAHSVYYGLVTLPGFEEQFLHGDVVAYGVLVQLAIDGQLEELGKLRSFLKELKIPVTLKDMGISSARGYLEGVLKETAAGPDMEHLPYPVSEDMIYEGMLLVEAYETKDK